MSERGQTMDRLDIALGKLHRALESLETSVEAAVAEDLAQRGAMHQEMEAMRAQYAAIRQATAKVSRRLLTTVDRLDARLTAEYADAA